MRKRFFANMHAIDRYVVPYRVKVRDLWQLNRTPTFKYFNPLEAGKQ
jgi:hypothetical protein